MTSELENAIRDDMDAIASEYESHAGHGIYTEEEEKAWHPDILDCVSFKPGSTCLDVAAGTGVLTRILAKWVGEQGHVVASDFAEKALKENSQLLPANLKERVSFLLGDTNNPEMLQSARFKSFDYVTCRQGVVLFKDPLKVFRNWFNWLNDGGTVVILDALWSRESWTGLYAPMVDQLPLSCLQTLATIPYLLQEVGFTIAKQSYLNRVNALYADSKDPNVTPPRFIVVAVKK